MTNNESRDWQNSWNAFLASGKWDEIKQPKDGYSIGSLVTGRDGIDYRVKGFTGNGDVILDGGKLGTKTMSKYLIRPSSDVGSNLILGGFVYMSSEKLIGAQPPTQFPGKTSQQN